MLARAALRPLRSAAKRSLAVDAALLEDTAAQLLKRHGVAGVQAAVIDAGEVKKIRLASVELARPFELSHERGELVLAVAVVEQLNLADELYFDPEVLQFLAARHFDGHCPAYSIVPPEDTRAVLVVRELDRNAAARPEEEHGET